MESKSLFRFKIFSEKGNNATAEETDLFTYAKHFGVFQVEITFFLIQRRRENGTK